MGGATSSPRGPEKTQTLPYPRYLKRVREDEVESSNDFQCDKNSSIYSLTHPFTHLLIHLLIHSSIYSFTHPFTHSLIHLLTHSASRALARFIQLLAN